MSEQQLMTTIKEILEAKGYFVGRFNPVRGRRDDGRWFDSRVPKGFPDLWITKNGRLYFAEVKTGRYGTSPEQETFLDFFRQQGFRAEVVKSVEDALKLVDEQTIG